MKKVFLLSIWAIACVTTGIRAQTLNPSQVQTVKEVFESFARDHDIVGLQTAIYDNGKVSTFNFGYADIEHKVPVTANTRFEIASITKAFTGLALYKLAATGKIDLQQDVRHYVPEFPQKDKGSITIDQLSGSLSGIRHYQDERDPIFYATHYDNVIDALNLFKDDPLVVTPGSQGHYSSYGYNLLAAAIQRASGVKFQDYVRQTILEPLKLTNTGFINVRLPMANRSRSYSFIDLYSRQALDQLQVIPTLEHSYNAGGGNMYSTALDLTEFARQFLKSGFVSVSTLEAVYTPHTDANGNTTLVSDGWGVNTLPVKAQHIVASGSYPGTWATIIVFPDTNVILTLLTNTWPKQTEVAQRQVLGGLLMAVGVAAKN